MAANLLQDDEDALGAAIRRMNGALAALDAKATARAATAGPHAEDLFDDDRARLSAELESSRARERALEEVASEASAALGRAAAEVRAALSAEES